MDARFYNSDEIDIERLGQDLVNIYLAQHYQAQNVGGKDQVLVQLKKGGDFEAILGMQAALTVTIQKTANGVLAMIGQQKWIDKAAVGAVGIAVLPLLWPLALTAGVGALRQASLGNQVLNMVDSLVRQQRPNIVAGPVPAQLLPQMQQQWAPHNAPPPYYAPQQPPPEIPVAPLPRPAAAPAPAPAPAGRSKLRCQYCNTPYEPGDTFCTGCGRSLTPPKVYCANCHAEVKPNMSFCANCGSSTFQTVTTANQPAQPKAAPITPTPTVTYTAPTPAQPAPPAKPAPYYTPPAQPAAQTPVYTPPPPPPAPKAPVYTPPAPPAKPPVPEYIPPPQMQEPPVKPQPKVTIIPGASKQEAPGLTPPSPTPQQTYYVPSASVAPTLPTQPPAPKPAADQPTIADAKPAAPEIPYYTPPASSAASADQPTIAGTGPGPLVPQPSSQPAVAPGTPWGTLTFSDGNEAQLRGERALVGRYDHDMGGITPDVDLNGVQGADTVSRVHASLEHIGSSYTLTDLNSTNASRINGKRLEPDKSTPINDGDTLQFGKITCTFKKA